MLPRTQSVSEAAIDGAVCRIDDTGQVRCDFANPKRSRVASPRDEPGKPTGLAPGCSVDLATGNWVCPGHPSDGKHAKVKRVFSDEVGHQWAVTGEDVVVPAVRGVEVGAIKDRSHKMQSYVPAMGYARGRGQIYNPQAQQPAMRSTPAAGDNGALDPAAAGMQVCYDPSTSKLVASGEYSQYNGLDVQVVTSFTFPASPNFPPELHGKPGVSVQSPQLPGGGSRLPVCAPGGNGGNGGNGNGNGGNGGNGPRGFPGWPGSGHGGFPGGVAGCMPAPGVPPELATQRGDLYQECFVPLGISFGVDTDGNIYPADQIGQLVAGATGASPGFQLFPRNGIFWIFGIRWFNDAGVVALESVITGDSDWNHLLGPTDVFTWRTDQCFCPANWGCISITNPLRITARGLVPDIPPGEETEAVRGVRGTAWGIRRSSNYACGPLGGFVGMPLPGAPVG